MNLPLIILLGSGALLLIFILLKMFQNRRGVVIIMPATRNRIEAKLQAKAVKFRDNPHGLNRKTLSLFHNYILQKFRVSITRFEGKVDRRSSNLISQIRGKQKLENRGEASDFLHDIKQFRDDFRKD